MHKYFLRHVHNQSCLQSFDDLSIVRGISLGQYSSSTLTFSRHLYPIGIMLGAKETKRKTDLSSPRTQSYGRERQTIHESTSYCYCQHTHSDKLLQEPKEVTAPPQG